MGLAPVPHCVIKQTTPDGAALTAAAAPVAIDPG